ncbi:type II toxin-antitoxin system VapB family antitoxin [Agrobacterium sp. NPDC089420]
MRVTIDLDDELIAEVMERTGLSTPKRRLKRP